MAIKQLDVVPIAGINSAGNAAGQPMTDADAQSFTSNTQLETDLPASVAAKDKPSLTQNDMLYAIRHNVTAWSATSFSAGAVVSHLGKFWYASSAAISTDVPGTASKWLQTGAPYIP